MTGRPENELGRSSGEKPHRGTLAKGHGLGGTEATQGQYAAVKNGILDWRHPSYFKGHDRIPVENASWCNAMSFCKKLTELEREIGWYEINSGNSTHPAGQKQPKATCTGTCGSGAVT